MKKTFETLNVLLTVCVFATALYMLFSPEGQIRMRYAEWRSQERSEAAAADLWPELMAGGSRLGRVGQKPTIVEFADYQCPACVEAHRRLDGLLALDTMVSIVFRHFPLKSHPQAENAARASICAEAQGRFQAFHETLFTTNSWQNGTDWTIEMLAAGIPDTAEFRTCLTSSATTARLADDRRLAELLGVNATPTFIHAEGYYRGLPDEDRLATLLRRATSE